MAYPTDLDSFTTKTTGQTIDASHINALQTAIMLLENRVGITGDEPIIATTKMLVYANTAPANWTIDSTVDDKLVFVTKGSVAGGQTGGGEHSTGTWTQPGHVLTIAEMPAHTHTVTMTYGTGAINLGNLAIYAGDGNTGPAGSGASHNHGSTWRPAAYNFILCTKDSYPTT